MQIAATLESDFDHFVCQKLIWLPAHQTTAMVGEARRSDGHKLTMTNWRANRLVDALAKGAEARWYIHNTVVNKPKAAKNLVRWRAAQLGMVTHMANNWSDLSTGRKGETVTKLHRDSSERPKRAPAPTGVPPPLPSHCCSSQAAAKND